MGIFFKINKSVNTFIRETRVRGRIALMYHVVVLCNTYNHGEYRCVTYCIEMHTNFDMVSLIIETNEGNSSFETFALFMFQFILTKTYKTNT
jgi:hypothetical protein